MNDIAVHLTEDQQPLVVMLLALVGFTLGWVLFGTGGR